MKYSAATVLAMATAVLGGSSMSMPANATVTYTTETVTAFTTYCPEATQITQDGTTYTITEATTFTINNCQCTHVYPVTVTTSASSSVSEVTYSPCPESATSVSPVSPPGKSAPAAVSVTYTNLFTTVPATGSVTSVPGGSATQVPANSNAAVPAAGNGNVVSPAKNATSGYQMVNAAATGMEVRFGAVMGLVGLLGLLL